LLRFVKLLLACRLDPNRDSADRNATLTEFLDDACLQWHGVRLDRPDWSPQSHSIAATARAPRLGGMVHWMLNAYWEPLDFELPPVPSKFDGPWRRWVDTDRHPPEDICEWRSGWPVTGSQYRVQPRSLVILFLQQARDDAVDSG